MSAGVLSVVAIIRFSMCRSVFRAGVPKCSDQWQDGDRSASTWPVARGSTAGVRRAQRGANFADRVDDVAKDIGAEIERFTAAGHVNSQRRGLAEMPCRWLDQSGLHGRGEDELFHDE